ncbi:amidohydrolase [Robertmurraya sp. DFI.2.37]|uniref:amidohydrolase n=1 Tax=Robertmurraya sp. DFI.2.37 TaxID=3031819 RepID=UPI0012484C24|nr:amidohydrolase [Robertmurraya sp. DFI.2.37]MDF1510895.1 amidohydrolase [Robertmurraya sp. DFI.2.37]
MKEILKWYREFHAIPEVGWKEFKTTEKIASILEEMGVGYERFSEMTGIIAEIGQGDEVIAVRADIDALWQEVDGVWQGNHSCGHDANIAMVLGAILYLREKPLKKKIRFIFQPAEEKGEGALALIEKGVMEQVTHLFGIHLRPIEELPLGKVSASIRHGAHVSLIGKVEGIDAHAARPHQGKNSLDVIVALHQLLNTIYIDPSEACSVKLTKVIAGGESINIIPGAAEFAIDVRAQKNDVLAKIRTQVEHIINHLEELFGNKIDWEWSGYTPAAEVSHEAEKVAEGAIKSLLGEEGFAPSVVTPGGDDFHFYTIKKPQIKASMIGVGANLQPGLHHPKMNFDQSALVQGAQILAETIHRA